MHLDGNSLDAGMNISENTNSVAFFLRGMTSDKLYSALEEKLKGQQVDVEIKQYSNDKVEVVTGIVDKVDKVRKYVAIKGRLGEIYPVFFVTTSYAITNMWDDKGNELYRNSRALTMNSETEEERLKALNEDGMIGDPNGMMCSQELITSLIEAGQFRKNLIPEKISLTQVISILTIAHLRALPEHQYDKIVS